MFRVFIIFIGLMLVAGCSRMHTQDTRGQSYLSSFQAAPKGAVKRRGIDDYPTLTDKIREAAAINPILKFPARIGLAKFENGRLVDISALEWSDWNVLSETNKKMGELIAVNVLGTANANRGYGRFNKQNNIEALRIAAAKQHLDAILIYEVDSYSRNYRNVFSVADLTLVGGAVLPTRTIKTQGNARVLLIDVRNGYPYGAASAKVDLKTYGTTFNAREQGENAKEVAKSESYQKLFPKIREIFEELLEKQKG